MEPTEWVIVDDTDPNLNYTGNWFFENGYLDSSGSWGPPYLSTVHGIQANGSVTYHFSGTGVLVTGAISNLPAATSERMTWQCVVDGSPIPVTTYSVIENWLDMCQSDLTDGVHTLVVNVVASPKQTFWLDSVQYIPSRGALLAEEALTIDCHDPSFQYSPDWIAYSPGFITNTTGAKISFSFNGMSLIWYGFYDSITYPFAETSATYSIDGSSPTSFPLNGVIATETAQHYQVIFQINGLPAGHHNLEVVYQGNASLTPLSLENVVYAGKDLSSQASSGPVLSPTTSTGPTGPAVAVPSSNSMSAPDSSTTAHMQKQKHGFKDLGIILGLSITALLLLLGGVIVWRRRRRLLPHLNNSSRLEVSPFYINSQPGPIASGLRTGKGESRQREREPGCRSESVQPPPYCNSDAQFYSS